jgi:transposase
LLLRQIRLIAVFTITSRGCFSFFTGIYFNNPPPHSRLKTIQRRALSSSCIRNAARSQDSRRPSDHHSVVNPTIVIYLDRNRSRSGRYILSIDPMIKDPIELAPGRPSLERLQANRRLRAPLVQTPMAPHLAQSQRSQLHDMIRSASLSDKDIAKVVNCSTRTVRSARANHRIFGSVSAPKNVHGRRSSIPSHILTALLDHLLTKPDLYLDEMVDFVWDQYEIVVSVASVRRSLKAHDWSKKKNRRVACERDPELRDACSYELSEYKSFHLVFVDESGCDTLAGVCDNAQRDDCAAGADVTVSRKRADT